MVVTTLATLVCAAPAHAAGYGAYRGVNDLVYQPGPGTASNATIRLEGDVYTIDDVVPIALGGWGCSHPGSDLTFVECTAADVTIIRVAASDLDDMVVNLTSTPAEIFGDEGDDHLEGGNGDDELWGGPGRDELEGHYGDDRLTGGTGSDVMVGGPGSYDSPLRPFAKHCPPGATLDREGGALQLRVQRPARHRPRLLQAPRVD